MSQESQHGDNPALATLQTAVTRLRAILMWRTGDRLRALQLALGLIWLIDAALQYQPYMFTRAFVTHVLQPSAQGVPGFLGDTITATSNFLMSDIAAGNALFATIQLAIAIGLMWKPAVRAALLGSIVWSITVWWLGEGFGGLFTGASPVMGAPGAAILYAILAILLWPPSAEPSPNTSVQKLSIAERSPLQARQAQTLWAVIWVGLSAYLLLPANRSADALHDLLGGMESGEPGWVKSVDRALASATAGNGLVISIILAGACLLIAVTVLLPIDRRSILAVAMAVAVVIWAAENFGGIFTGTGTDVNTGPLLVLLILSYWTSPSCSPTTAGGCPQKPSATGWRARRERGEARIATLRG